LVYLGVQVDAARNAKAIGDQAVSIHADNSAIEVWVVPTDEGRVAAQDALAFL
jgi:acetate kinase